MVYKPGNVRTPEAVEKQKATMQKKKELLATLTQEPEKIVEKVKEVVLNSNDKTDEPETITGTSPEMDLLPSQVSSESAPEKKELKEVIEDEIVEMKEEGIHPLLIIILIVFSIIICLFVFYRDQIIKMFQKKEVANE